MYWPDLKFPPINLWSLPVQEWIAKDHPETTILTLNKEQCAKYMERLKWLSDNPMNQISVSELVLSRRER
jgi:hypothetical protein